MGFFGKIIGAAVDVAITPVAVVKDIVTMGGALDDQDIPHTAQRLGKAVKKLSDAADDAADGDLI